MPYGYGSANRGSKGSAAPGGTGGGGWSPGAGRSKTGYLKTHPSHGGGGGNTPPPKKTTPPKRTIGEGINRILNNPIIRTYAAIGTGGASEKLRKAHLAKQLYDNRYILDDEAIEEEVRNVPVTGGIVDIFNNLLGFSHAGAAEMSKEEYNQLLKDAGVTGTTTTDLGPKPDLTDPYIQSKIAEAAGLTTTPQTVGGKKILGVQVGGDLLNLPTSRSLDAMKQMQIDKRDNLMSLEDVQQKASDFEYPTSLNPEQTKTMYDMVRLQQPDQRTLVANGGLINLFKYGGFLG
jgi:hypothetical protein